MLLHPELLWRFPVTWAVVRSIHGLRFECDPSGQATVDGPDDYRLLADNLSSLLSRCTKRALQREFKVTSKAYKALRVQLALRANTVALPAGMLNDLAHEIAQYADAATHAAALRCLRKATGRRRSSVAAGAVSALH